MAFFVSECKHLACDNNIHPAIAGDRNNKMKQISYKLTHDGAFVEFKYELFPKRGYFKDVVQPMLNVFKTMVPATFRSYDPATYKWETTIEYWNAYTLIVKAAGFTLKELAEPVGPNVNVPKDYADNFYRAPEPPQKQVRDKYTLQQEFEVLLLQAGTFYTFADLNDVNKAKSFYRKAALALHPDRNNGDGSKMSSLNEIWTQLQPML